MIMSKLDEMIKYLKLDYLQYHRDPLIEKAEEKEWGYNITRDADNNLIMDQTPTYTGVVDETYKKGKNENRILGNKT